MHTDTSCDSNRSATLAWLTFAWIDNFAQTSTIDLPRLDQLRRHWCPKPPLLAQIHSIPCCNRHALACWISGPNMATAYRSANTHPNHPDRITCQLQQHSAACQLQQPSAANQLQQPSAAYQLLQPSAASTFSHQPSANKKINSYASMDHTVQLLICTLLYNSLT